MATPVPTPRGSPAYWLRSRLERFLRRPLPPGSRGRLLRDAQIATLAFLRHREGHSGDYAASLAFATLISALPVALLVIAASRALGVSVPLLEHARTWAFSRFVPETAIGVTDALAQELLQLDTKRRTLGVSGLLLLVPAGSKLPASLGRSFDAIWGHTGVRLKLRRLILFWSTTLSGAILVAVSLDAGRLLGLPLRGPWGTAAAFAALWLAHTIAYVTFPGGRPSVRAATIGALVATLLWTFLKRAFASIVRHAVEMSAVVATLGILPLFLLWLGYSWTAFLMGAHLAYAAERYDEALARTGHRRRPEPRLRAAAAVQLAPPAP